MAASKSEPRKKRYEVKNWKRYNEALVTRGDFTFYFSEEVVDAWEHANDAKKNGRPFLYSDVAIETLLTIRELFRLPYRQTEGFGRALAKLLDAGVAIPHHTSLVKRAAKLKVSIAIDPAKGPIEVVVDSTGLKVFGDGEWRRKKHGVDKRRTYRKVHLAVDPENHAIVAQLLTDSSVHDGNAVKPLLEQVEQEVETFYGDGAYDQWKVREHLEEERIHQIIPPRKGAVIKQHGNSNADPIERDECVRQIRRDGKKSWKESIGYHRRSPSATDSKTASRPIKPPNSPSAASS
ncbi:IS5 family transposase [Botrimarina hoheduenensis]|uniref:Transposase DDE domain protein n=1 Tax=Botrimarina hoheduenensis TaxID=2528000 RepID=A0A5C5VR09_9BACT|nr:IS5 family transposase [Botrimarina hoheduenensis]TWT40109.1 Transposase DDE domain protein [Botrimarina hoheduenensis]